MLNLTHPPRQIRMEQGVAYKTAQLQGQEENITWVANQRLNDRHCSQAPRGDCVPSSYYIRVGYTISPVGHLIIEEIKVSFSSSSSKTWSLFYGKAAGSHGTVDTKEGQFKRYFLEDDGQLDEIARLLRDHEETKAIKRLTSMGPDAFKIIRKKRPRR